MSVERREKEQKEERLSQFRKTGWIGQPNSVNQKQTKYKL
jgi:hypothetical protein